MEKNLTGYLIDIEKGIAVETTIEDKLACFYGILNCEYIECHDITINGDNFTVVMDEEARLKGKSEISIHGTLYGNIVGNVFLVKTDYSNGEFISLTSEEISNIKANMYLDKKGRPVLVV